MSGKITLSPGWAPRLYLVKANYYRQWLAPYEGTVVDSAKIAPDGTFAFSSGQWLKEPGAYTLFIQPVGQKFRQSVEEAPDAFNAIPCVLAPGSAPLRLNAHATALNRTAVWEQADAENRQLLQVCHLREPLIREYLAQKNAPPAEEEEEMHHGSPARDSVLAAFDQWADTTGSAWAAFLSLRLRAPENELRDRPEHFIQVQQRIAAQYPQHPWNEQLGQLLRPELLPVLKGEKMPLFALPGMQGDTLRLEDLKFKVILVDFWASWCAPCRKEIRQTLIPMYSRYHSKGFEILGVSIDGGRAAWENALRKDGVTWPNVSDLLGDASPVRQSLRFETIPANYLLDSEGRLLARNLHGAALEAALKQYLGE